MKIYSFKEADAMYDFMRYSANGIHMEVAINGRNEVLVSIDTVSRGCGIEKSVLLARLVEPLFLVRVGSGVMEFAQWEDMEKVMTSLGKELLHYPPITRMMVASWAQ